MIPRLFLPRTESKSPLFRIERLELSLKISLLGSLLTIALQWEEPHCHLLPCMDFPSRATTPYSATLGFINVLFSDQCQNTKASTRMTRNNIEIHFPILCVDRSDEGGCTGKAPRGASLSTGIQRAQEQKKKKFHNNVLPSVSLTRPILCLTC